MSGKWRLSGWPLPLRSLSEVERERLLRTALELRERGLPYGGIAVVFELYENVEVNEGQVRTWLHRNGVPRNEYQAPNARRMNMRRRVAA